MTRIGSLFSGYGGLDAGVQSVLGGSVAWHSEIDPGACKILAHRFPDVPNLGDVSVIDWSTVGPVDVLCGGFPCQDVSAAGKRAGIAPGTRSGLWAEMARAIQALRPPLVVIENVRGLLSADAHHPAHGDLEPCPWCLGDDEPVLLRALGAVLGDLADIGFDAEWVGLRAADVGAPHGRFRVFVVAWPAGADSAERGRRPEGRDDRVRPARLVAESPDADIAGLEGAEPAAGRLLPDGGAPADADRLGHERSRRARHGRPGPADGAVTATDADDAADDGQRSRTEPRPGGAAAPHAHGGPVREQPVALAGSGGQAVPGLACADAPADADRDGLESVGRLHAVRCDADGRGSAHTAWGDYEPAVRRWEQLTRPAPAPTELSAKGSPRLSPAFVEWLMGLPAGWVTGVPGLTRNEQLKALGNGVVPQQAAEALRMLLPGMEAVA